MNIFSFNIQIKFVELKWTEQNVNIIFLQEFRDSPVVISTASNLDHGHVNPATNGEFTIFTPLSPPHHNNNIFQASHQVSLKNI